MIDFGKISCIYFVGIGGIGMSAMARYFAASGLSIGGYDRTESTLTKILGEEGMKVMYIDDPGNIPSEFLNPDTTVVVYTPAVPSSNKILTFFREKGYELKKRSEMLGIISGNSRTIAIAGTHGKTSVTTITAHLLKQSHIDCLAFLGGISKNYMTNMLAGTGNLIVMEADEYDRSFHKLKPAVALITSLDADHLDVYGSHENMIKAYEEFASKIIEGGTIVLNEKIAGVINIPDGINKYTYGFSDSSDFYAGEKRIEKGAYKFNIYTPDSTICDLSLLVPGRMNIENSVGAVALAHLSGMKETDIRKALEIYKGVERRFDVRLNTERVVYIDDYAHHPAELDYCIGSVRELYPGKSITGVFQPHLYSRTRDHAKAFASSLDKLDRLILLPVYPAREDPVEGVDSGIIFKRMDLDRKELAEKAEVPDLIRHDTNDIILTMGAGDIDRLVKPIEEILNKRI